MSDLNFLRPKKKKKLRRVEPFGVTTYGGRFFVAMGGGPEALELSSITAARRLAGIFNREYRSITFRPKSSGRRARTKGHQFEREVAALFREVFPGARRHLEYQDSQAVGVDIAEVGLLRIQCKRLKMYATLSTIEEVEADRMLGDIPVLVTAADQKEPIAALYLSEFLYLVKAARKILV